jgi:hypothetical protein
MAELTIARDTGPRPASIRWLNTSSITPRFPPRRGALYCATHARRHPVDKQPAGVQRGRRLRPSPPAVTAASVTRKVDSSGNVSFAGTNYRVGPKFRRRQVQVASVDGTVEISIGEELIRVHPIRHDRTREHGALANSGGRPRRINAA